MNPKARIILLWIGRVLIAGVFIMAGSQKLAGAKMMVDVFGAIGLGQGFRYLTGLIEVGGALLLLWPRTSFLAALLLLCVLAGAFIAQAFVLHGDVIHVLVLAAIVALLAWFQRPGVGRIGTSARTGTAV